MKKLLLLTACVAFCVSSMNAQGEFNAGVSGGLPIGDAGDLATFSVMVDVGYFFEVSDAFKAGPFVGFQQNFGDSFDTVIGSIDIPDVQFLPVGGGARFMVADAFTLGADLGYAVGINDGNDGGFYYAPRAQYAVSEAIDIVLSYRGVSLDGGSWDVVGLGIEFGL